MYRQALCKNVVSHSLNQLLKSQGVVPFYRIRIQTQV